MKKKLKLVDEAITAWKEGELTDHTAFIAIYLIVMPQNASKEAIKWAQKIASQTTVKDRKVKCREWPDCGLLKDDSNYCETCEHYNPPSA